MHERVGRGERGSRASSPPQRRGDRPEPLHQRHFLHGPTAAAAAAATAAAAGPRPEVNALLATPSGGRGARDPKMEALATRPAGQGRRLATARRGRDLAGAVGELRGSPQMSSGPGERRPQPFSPRPAQV